MQLNQSTNQGMENVQPNVETAKNNTTELGDTTQTQERPVPAVEKAPTQSSSPPKATPQPQTIQPAQQSTGSTSSSQSLPADSDEDLIEKPWVQKAEQIIKDDKGDPHKLGDDENKLNKDYLKARFNYDVEDAS